MAAWVESPPCMHGDKYHTHSPCWTINDTTTGKWTMFFIVQNIWSGAATWRSTSQRASSKKIKIELYREPPTNGAKGIKTLYTSIDSTQLRVTEITQPCVHTCDGLFICQLYLIPEYLIYLRRWIAKKIRLWRCLLHCSFPSHSW
jgi:hypothetical protein